MQYVRDPAEIYDRSFAIIRKEVDFSALPASLEPVAVRLIHACGMTDILADLRFDESVAVSGAEALRKGAPVIVDCEMAGAGIIRRFLPAANEVICTLNAPEVMDLAKLRDTTRSAAAVSLWLPHMEGAVIVIGNAPTALFALLELLDAGAPAPAAILGFPVGFVGAAESKAELAANPREKPFLTLLGRRGGSAMAGAALNAIAREASA